MLWKHTFQRFVDKRVYKINRRFAFTDKCLVYLLSCKVCGRQYTGQTVDECRYRWNNYKDNNRKSLREDEHKRTGFFSYFQSLDHNGCQEDTEITFIDKTDPSDPTRCEEFWIDTLKTRYPLGFNNRHVPSVDVFEFSQVTNIFMENVIFFYVEPFFDL